MVLTEPIAGMHSGLPNVRDHDLSVYLKTQGDSMAIGGYEQNPEFWPDVDPGFSFGLFELDYDTFGQNLAGAHAAMPSDRGDWDQVDRLWTGVFHAGSQASHGPSSWCTRLLPRLWLQLNGHDVGWRLCLR